MIAANEFIVLARRIAVDTPEQTHIAGATPADEQDRKHHDILAGCCDDAWSIRAIAAGIERGCAIAEDRRQRALAFVAEAEDTRGIRTADHTEQLLDDALRLIGELAGAAK